MLAPAQISATQVPPKEPLPADARKPDRVLRVGDQYLPIRAKGEISSKAVHIDVRMWNLQTICATKIHNVWSWPFASGGESHLVWASSQTMAVSPDGKWLAPPAGGCEPNGAVEICDAATGEKLQIIPAHGLVVTKVAFSRDGRRLLTVGQDRNPMMVQGQPGVTIAYPRISVWDTATWKLEFSLTFPSTAGTDAEISADGKLLAVTKGGSATQLFDLEQKKAVATFASPEGRSGFLAISPDGRRLLRCGPEVEGS